MCRAKRVPISSINAMSCSPSRLSQSTVFGFSCRSFVLVICFSSQSFLPYRKIPKCVFLTFCRPTCVRVPGAAPFLEIVLRKLGICTICFIYRSVVYIYRYCTVDHRNWVSRFTLFFWDSHTRLSQSNKEAQRIYCSTWGEWKGSTKW